MPLCSWQKGHSCVGLLLLCSPVQRMRPGCLLGSSSSPATACACRGHPLAGQLWALLQLLAALLTASLTLLRSSEWMAHGSLLCALLQLLAGRPCFSLTDNLVLSCRGPLQLCFGRCCSCWLHPLRRYQEIFNTEAWSSAIKVGASQLCLRHSSNPRCMLQVHLYKATILGYDCSGVGLTSS